MQHKKILGRKLPEALKLSIAKKMENNLFSKVILVLDDFVSHLIDDFVSHLKSLMTLYLI